MKAKKILLALGAAAGLASAGSASAIVVGGIDYGTLGLTQEIETTTFAETFVNAPGQNLQGYGVVTRVNGDATYCADNTSNCTLYFFLHDYTVQSFTPSAVTFTGGVIDIYYSSSASINFYDQNAAANIAYITGQTPYVELTGHTFTDPIFNAANPSASATYTLNGNGSLTGGSISETGAGQVDVALGGFGMPAVQAFLNGNGASDNLGGFADKVLGASSNNLVTNPMENCPGPGTQPTPGTFCLEGTASIRGLTVPEPGTLALLGVSLLGVWGARRRRTR